MIASQTRGEKAPNLLPLFFILPQPHFATKTPPMNLCPSPPPTYQPELELVSFNTSELLSRIRAAHFPHFTSQISHLYTTIPTLASITTLQPKRHIISLHSILNHPTTPEPVIRHILTHELIHIEIPPRELRHDEDDPRPRGRRGRRTSHTPLGKISHPPEFWQREATLSPESSSAMEWIYLELGPYIKVDPVAERICVKPNWKSCGWIRER